MNKCEWCEEEIGSKSFEIRVIGKLLTLCQPCQSAYENDGIKEFNKRRNWDNYTDNLLSSSG
jgi:ribosome-binding protein aMBF1 (putative translation factor)